MFFNDKLTPSKIPPQSKAQEMRDVSKKAMLNVVEKEYNKTLALIRATAEAGYRDFTTYEISRNVDEIIQNCLSYSFVFGPNSQRNFSYTKL